MRSATRPLIRRSVAGRPAARWSVAGRPAAQRWVARRPAARWWVAGRPAARWSTAAVAALLVLLAGCAGGGDGDAAAPPDATEEPAPALAACDGLTSPPPNAPERPADSDAVDGSDGMALPALTLPCFIDDVPFDLSRLRGPAVVNLWASFCLPCLDELPALQRLADRAGDRVHVVGVVTADSRTKAAWLADDLDLTFASLYDREERLSVALGRYGLPVTAFVDGQGRVVHVYQGEPFDDQRLAGLIEEHLGVAVESG